MGALTDDMARLRDEINGLHRSRKAFINDLSNFTSTLKTNVGDMRKAFRSEHAQTADTLSNDLATFVSGLKRDVSDMKQGFRRQHTQRAAVLVNNLGTFVSGLKRDVSDMKQRFRQQHTQTADTLSTDLRSFTEKLNKTVSSLRQEFTNDIGGAHHSWIGRHLVDTSDRENEKTPSTKRELKPNQQPNQSALHEEAGAKAIDEKNVGNEEVINAAEETEEPDGIVLDKLTTIGGIGENREKLLREAGIYTFSQLADTSPEKLKEILGETLGIKDLKRLAEAARKLM
jgi:predicted flap endonuclease-1-like 5' DNA nuclease